MGNYYISDEEHYGLIVGSLRKPRRQRERQRRETKALMSRTIAVHVRYNSWYISLPSSAKKGLIFKFLFRIYPCVLDSVS